MTYSAGNWHDEGYGVGVATSPSPQGPWVACGEGAAFLSSSAAGLIGPGHNSLFTGHDGQTYAVFHAWDPGRERRRPHIAPVDWTGAIPALR